MAEVKSLILERGTIKSQLTRLSTFLDKIDPAKLDGKLILELKCRKLKLESIWTEFDKVQRAIESRSNEDALDAHHAESDEFETKFFKVMATIDSLLEGVNPSSIIFSSANMATPSSSNLNLPAISIQTFDGTYESWGTFKQMFINLIHNNLSLNDIQRFYYLRGYLNKSTLKLIENLEINQENYKAAWELLRNRFENKRLTVHNHISGLFSIPVMAKENYQCLRDMSDKLENHLVALKNLGQDISSWDSIIIYLISSKLDQCTKREWERSVSSLADSLPQFKQFLITRCQILEATQHNHETPPSKQRASSLTVTGSAQCQFCKVQGHLIYNCDMFSKLSVSDRTEQAKQKRLCLNCLNGGHFSSDCKSTRTCRFCHRKHHSLLHNFKSKSTNAPPSDTKSPISSINEIPSLNATSEPRSASNLAKQPLVNNHSVSSQTQVILATVALNILDKNGRKHQVRGLIDPGSQVNFVTESLINTLNLPTMEVEAAISGVGCSAHTISRKTTLKLQSSVNQFRFDLECFILPNITEHMPSVSFEKSDLKIPHNVRLADPDFNKSDKIDVLLGASISWNLLCVGQYNLGKNLPVLQKTRLGWLVSGQMPINPTRKFTNSHCGFVQNLNLERFWDIEPDSADPVLTKEEDYVESLFLKTTKRNDEGRFIVSVPLRENIEGLGNTRTIALKRFYSLEKRLAQDQGLQQDYIKFMQEYRSLGHMVPIDHDSENTARYQCYLPHHFVFKTTSNTTKTRVVFDASTKSDTGLSLNDCQYVGPTVQSDLFATLVRFRKHQFVIAADIEKMYRQILLAPEDRALHRIFWRETTNDPIVCYELQTVTYGTAAAPYQATRCLKQLGLENKDKYPQASDAIIRDFYMDDLLTGSDSVRDLLVLKETINNILTTAGFILRKWISNTAEVCQGTNTELDINIEHESKILGVHWSAVSDSITYTINKELHSKSVTKRSILSVIAQIYDPLGLLSPTIVLPRLIVQQLWRFRLSWDESLPHDLHTQWLNFYDQLPLLNNLEIPRKIICHGAQDIQLHGFSDASERAYGACVYLRSRSSNEVGYDVRLVCARSRVAPLRQITLPRLELCAAVLLAELMQKVIRAIDINFNACYYWTDSKIVLSWINSSSRDWQTFVANRIATIQRASDPANWHHIESKSNPADLLSRGVAPSRLKSSSLWWNGPPILRNDIPLDSSDEILEDIPEKRRCVAMTTVSLKVASEIFKRYSSLSKLKRTVAWILRFYHNLNKLNPKFVESSLAVEEVEAALLKLVKIAQAERFGKEINKLQHKGCVGSDSALLSLHPFLDDDLILRVGGRIRYSNNLYDKKHPILLPKRHPLTTLIIKDFHSRNLHCGNQALLSIIRERFWPISGRNEVKRVINRCIICFKVKPKPQEYLMGNLPSYRLNPTPVFYNCGLDYAGPFLLKDKATRGCKLIKSYICLFICMATRAVHLELVGSLSTESFLNCLKRFISRRGKPANLYSDNASNFLGAFNEIQEITNFLNSKPLQDKVSQFLTDESINWKFIPPRGPHFGGSWEAGIKSVKFHMKRILGNANLIYEDFNTILVQIEGILNSRPLTPMSSDPDDLNLLTPGHFLVGRALATIPERDLQHVRENRLSLYQRIELLKQQFWRRWSKDYIAELQKRNKWRRNVSTSIKEGAIVLIAEDNLPPLKWRLGKIIHLHYGKDGIARVADLKTANGTIKRPVVKLCVLPAPKEETEEVLLAPSDITPLVAQVK